MSEDEDADSRNKLMIFGTNVAEIPCFRKTFLVSISSGLASGLGHFLFTSKVRRSVHIGYGTFFVVTFGVWIHCRYNYAMTSFENQKIKQAIREIQLLQGTKEGEEIEAEIKARKI